jgi:hypothetical protein
MSQQGDIELEMRISALEYLLCRLNVAVLAATVPLDQINQRLDEFAEGAGKQLSPTVTRPCPIWRQRSGKTPPPSWWTIKKNVGAEPGTNRNLTDGTRPR